MKHIRQLQWRLYFLHIDKNCTFFTFREKIQGQHKKEMHDIQDIMFAMEEEWNEQESEAKQDFQSLRDEIKNKVSIVF